MRIREERQAEKEWSQQEETELRRRLNWERLMQKRKYFCCGSFKYIVHNCRNRESREKKEVLI